MISLVTVFNHSNKTVTKAPCGLVCLVWYGRAKSLALSANYTCLHERGESLLRSQMAAPPSDPEYKCEDGV